MLTSAFLGGAPTMPETPISPKDGYVAALRRELAGYELHSNDDRAAQVRAELARVGADAVQETADASDTGEAMQEPGAEENTVGAEPTESTDGAEPAPKAKATRARSSRARGGK